MAEEGQDEWCTIESDPGVFTELLETLGCQQVELQELYTLDDDSLAALQQQSTIYGFIFLFQWIGEKQAEHAAQKEPLAEEDIPEDLFFAHQITSNACATQALLSVVLNAQDVKLGDTLTEFQSFTKSFPPQLKGVAISSSEPIRTAHNSFARPDGFLSEGDNKRIKASEQAEAFHFVAYVPVNGILYELDGLQKGPMIVGAFDDDWLTQARTAIEERMAGHEHVKFNLMAVIQDKRVSLQARLDAAETDDEASALLAAEQAKRDQWHAENQRRRHNYVPLCVQLLKELARAGQLPGLVTEARERQAQKRQKTNSDK